MYLAKRLAHFSEWQERMWNAVEKPRHVMADRKNVEMSVFSCSCTSIAGRIQMYSSIPMNAVVPTRTRIQYS